MSQEDFGDLIGMSEENVKRLEKPGPHMMRPVTFRTMAEKLGKTLDELREAICVPVGGVDEYAKREPEGGSTPKASPRLAVIFPQPGFEALIV